MAQSPPAGKASNQKKKKKRRGLTTAWATVLAAIIAGAAGFAGGYFPKKDTGTITPAPSASLGPEVLTINQPPSGDISWKDDYSGKAMNVRPGHLVWTFNQTVTNGKVSSKVYPDTGPCMVDYARQQWACSGVFVGSKADNKTYMICAAIIDASTAFTIVDDLRSGAKDFSIPLDNLPSIHDGTSSCMSAHRA